MSETIMTVSELEGDVVVRVPTSKGNVAFVTIAVSFSDPDVGLRVEFNSNLVSVQENMNKEMHLEFAGRAVMASLAQHLSSVFMIPGQTIAEEAASYLRGGPGPKLVASSVHTAVNLQEDFRQTTKTLFQDGHNTPDDLVLAAVRMFIIGWSEAMGRVVGMERAAALVKSFESIFLTDTTPLDSWKWWVQQDKETADESGAEKPQGS